MSALVHGLVLALLILGPLLLVPREKPAEEAPPPSPIAMVFEPPKDGARSVPEPSPMATLPVPPSPPAPPAPAPRPLPAPTPPSPRPAPPHPSPAEPPRAAPAATPPAKAPPPPPPTKMAALPMPLRPPQLTPPEPVPRPERPRPMPRPRPQSAFPAPMNFSFGTPRAQSRPAEQPSPPTYGPAARGSFSFGQFARVVSGKVDPSWLSRLHEWWLRHGYYPDQAAARGEDGRVAIEIVVDRYGRVNQVELESKSGSMWLDMAAQGVFRGANLPPLPPDTTDPQITLDLTIDYILIRR